MQLSLLLFFVFISLIIGFVAAWLLQSRKVNDLKRGYETTVNQALEEKNILENQYIVSQERLTLRTEELLKIQGEFQKINNLAENRGMELAGIRTTNANLLEKLENQKREIIEMQNNAKENIRSKYGIPRELIDAYNGSSKGSTYENQQYAEARFTLNSVKNITDSWLYSLEKQNPIHFKNKGHKLIGTYDHMPSVIGVQTKMRNEGFKAKGDALNVVLDAFVKSKELGIQFDYESFLKENGFEDFLTTQSTE